MKKEPDDFCSLATAGWRFWVDRGGTFTDIVAVDPLGRLSTCKRLSEGHGSDPAVAGMRAMLGLADGAAIPDGLVDCVKMGTTVATNALLQRRGEAVLLLVNTGFADLLRIGDQTRHKLFDLKIEQPEPLYADVAEIGARMDADGIELYALDEAAACSLLQAAARRGIRACAIALIHAWKFPEHEIRLAELAREAGFSQVSASHEVSPLMRLIPRAQTTLVDAYLSPVLRRAVDQLAKDFARTRLFFMQSHGGLAAAAHFRGKDAILSGPAGGIVGAARTAERAGFSRVISFDMGGTSTDVALYDGELPRRFASEIAGVQLQTPMLAIHTIAAGGGSVLRFESGRLRVGPESEGAQPGPAAYRAGGSLTVTDANVLLGKIQPAHFPAIFGAGADQTLDAAIVERKFAALAEEIARETGAAPRDPRDVAEGFLRVAVANMANAIRHVSLRQGHDVTRFVLNCFGGAGGQHACRLAEELGMRTVLIHPFAGMLSAYGMGLADQTVLRERAVEQVLSADVLAELRLAAEELAVEGTAALVSQGEDPHRLHITARLLLRYRGTDAALPVPIASLAAMQASFAVAHQARFGFVTPDRELIAEAVTVDVTAPGEPLIDEVLAERETGMLEAVACVDVWSNGKPYRAPVYERQAFRAGDTVMGPALIKEAGATTVIEPGWIAEMTSRNDMILHRGDACPALPRSEEAEAPRDPMLLEVFNNLFMNIAEQAGAVLQNVATSVNIKERLDFSCAIFDAQGNLVANAPHVPVHLGAMGESVKSVLSSRGESLREGDVVALNNPFNGGTHLPDITVITPVFAPGTSELRFFSACRGHHADIGGLTPGSTPPFSRRLDDEGVIIDDFLLIADGRLRESEFRALLLGGRFPARNPDMNVADIKAQIAANEKAAHELRKVTELWGWTTVQAYMGHVMDNAEESVRRVIAGLKSGHFATTLDDGTPLRVAITIDTQERTALVDFSGTGQQQATNFNAPPAVTRAVVLYVFRCLAGQDIPLNEGCLKPVTLVIPVGSFLAPPAGSAVVAGNTEVSQIVCNALLGALGVSASSQATMNNFLFGDSGVQYYETICGGAGAGVGHDGASAVHTHMTNTRMTDPEVLEMRFPVRLEQFAIRHGSGGAGRWRGGDGAIRRVRFLRAMQAVSVASRRTVAPFGLRGGADGACGRQWVERGDGTITSLGGADSAQMEPGDVFVIHTPGGGGYEPEL